MRIEFKIQIIATPVSAKTAAHMEAKPIRPSIMMSILHLRQRLHLPCYANGIARNIYCLENRMNFRIHKYYISSFNGSISTTAHSSTNISTSENRSVVYTIADKKYITMFLSSEDNFLIYLQVKV